MTTTVAAASTSRRNKRACAPSPPATVSFQDLDRDELLELFKRVAPFVGQRDFRWAQWEVAVARSRHGRDQARVALDEMLRLSREDAAAPTVSRRIRLKRQASYAEARASYERAMLRAERAEAREDRLYAALDATRPGA